MDDTELLKMSGASAGTIAIILLVYKILKSMIGKRFISKCCDKKIEVGLDIKETPNTPVVVEIKNPMLKENELRQG